jgi:hypothetical protein
MRRGLGDGLVNVKTGITFNKYAIFTKIGGENEMGLFFFSRKNQSALSAVKPDAGIDTLQENQLNDKAVLVPANIRVGLKA